MTVGVYEKEKIDDNGLPPHEKISEPVYDEYGDHDGPENDEVAWPKYVTMTHVVEAKLYFRL